jgi:hypothetical protein
MTRFLPPAPRISARSTARIRVIILTNRTFDLRAEAAMDEMAAGLWRLTAR